MCYLNRKGSKIKILAKKKGSGRIAVIPEPLMNTRLTQDGHMQTYFLRRIAKRPLRSRTL